MVEENVYMKEDAINSTPCSPTSKERWIVRLLSKKFKDGFRN